MSSHPLLDSDLEKSLRAQARQLNRPEPSILLVSLVLHQARMGTPALRARHAMPWKWIPAMAALVVLLGAWSLKSSGTIDSEITVSSLSPALNLSALTDKISVFPSILDHASDPYRKEWDAVRADVTSSGTFLLELVNGFAGAGKAL